MLVLILASCAGSPGDLPQPGITTEPCSSVAALDLPEEVVAATEAIDAAGLLESVTYLGSDDLEGRGPGSDGDRKTREYLAKRLAAYGYEPAFAGGAYDQRLKIVGVTAHMPETWSFRASTDGSSAGTDGPRDEKTVGGNSGQTAGAQAGGDVSFRFLDEYMGGSGVQQPKVDIENAEVIFVGYGIEAPEESWDDFKGEDLSGKVLLMLNDDPHWDPDLFAGERKLFYGRWTYKFESAARQGAAAAIIIHTTPSAGYPWVVVRTSWSGEQFELEAGDEPRTLLNAWLTEDAATRLAALGGHDLPALMEQARSREFRPAPLNVTTSLSFEVGVRETETANVAGILRGSDPALADQLVIFSAHHDHLGLGEPDETGDRIYNGALDNGVAMAQVLEVAEAVVALPEPPRRSVMIFFPAAEEQGLLGSAYFARSNAFHPGRMAADINLELGNIWGRTRDVVIFGRGKATLEDDLESAALLQERTITAEEDVRAGWYYRSDQFSLAKVGVPAIWFRSGTDFIDRPVGEGSDPFAAWIENNYHRPTDEVTDEWVMDGLVEDAQLAFWVGAAVANRDELPAWYPGDEFEDERAAALAEAEHQD
jgi:Zn-dependent M28 family amino/carboxypeptidase